MIGYVVLGMHTGLQPLQVHCRSKIEKPLDYNYSFIIYSYKRLFLFLV